MKINKCSVEFKSDEHIFKKEKSGRKPNTVRILTREERDAVEKLYLTSMKPIRITIHNYELKDRHTVHRKFVRTLTDISCCGDFLGFYIYVFSWKAEQVRP